MMRIEAIIPPSALEDVASAVDAAGVRRMFVSEISERNFATGPIGVYRGARYRVAVPRVKVEILVTLERCEELMAVIFHAARFTSGDDGSVIAHELSEAFLIKTGTPLEYSDK